MRISVVTPMFNAQAWLGETLESVLHQRHQLEDVELILVDDASRDDSVALARDFIRQHALNGRVLTRERNAGVSAARNAGWRTATGDWVQFLDADDLLAPNKLELQSCAAAQAEHEVAVVYSTWQHFGQPCGRWQPTGPLMKPTVDTDSVARILGEFYFGYLGPTLIRKTALEAVGGFDERLHIGEDIDLMLRIAMAGFGFREAHSREPLFFYRDTPGSLWRKGIAHPQSMRDLAQVFRRAELFLRERDSNNLAVETRRALANRYGRCLDALFEQDAPTFRAIVAWIGALGLRCPPEARPSIRWVAQLLGYENALRLRAIYRRGAEGRA